MKVYILAGIPGSGKSTFRRTLSSKLEERGASVDYVSADDYMVDENGDYCFEPSKLDFAHNSCLKRFLQFVTQPNNLDVVFVDNTNTTLHEISPYAQIALAYGHDLEVGFVVADPQEAFQRCVHNVPEDIVLKMHERLQTTKANVPERWNPDSISL